MSDERRASRSGAPTPADEERNLAPAAFLPADRPEIEQAFK